MCGVTNEVSNGDIRQPICLIPCMHASHHTYHDSRHTFVFVTCIDSIWVYEFGVLLVKESHHTYKWVMAYI